MRCPSILTSVDSSMLVQVSAPGHQTRPHGTSAPNSSRPRATGRLYSIVIFVPAICWLTEPCWLGRTAGAGLAPASSSAPASAAELASTNSRPIMDSFLRTRRASKSPSVSCEWPSGWRRVSRPERQARLHPGRAGGVELAHDIRDEQHAVGRNVHRLADPPIAGRIVPSTRPSCRNASRSNR